MPLNLDALRRRVDRVDSALVRLLNQRAGLALAIGSLKHRDPEAVFYYPDREQAIVDRLTQTNHGPLLGASIQAIFREIISACRNLQKPIRVAYLEASDALAHHAAARTFGHAADYVSAPNIADVFDAVETRRADYGVVPIEISREGLYSHTLDMFIQYDLKICAEILMGVPHYLLARATNLLRITRIYAPSTAIPQARKWIKDNLPEAKLVEVSSAVIATAHAKRSPQAAAVVPTQAARLYGLRTLAPVIHDTASFKRFYVIGAATLPPTGLDKTSLMFSVRDRVGGLHAALTAFQRCGVNLSRIHTRPSQDHPWEYVFFVDFDGHPSQARIRRALHGLRRLCTNVRVLGSYPRLT